MRQRLDREGRLTLPKELLAAIGVRPGQEVRVSGQGKRIVIERYIPKDPFAKPQKEKKVSFDGLLAQEEKRRQDAANEFEARMKNPPKVSELRPEDHPDFWR